MMIDIVCLEHRHAKEKEEKEERKKQKSY